jgi:hypothetical protein
MRYGGWAGCEKIEDGLFFEDYPTINGANINFFIMGPWETLFIVGYNCLFWLMVVTLQLLSLLSVPLHYFYLILYDLAFCILWLLIGTLLFYSKILAFRKVWNVWMQGWTKSHDFDMSDNVVLLDTLFINNCFWWNFALETVPFCALQIANNQIVGWYSLAIVSMTGSIYMSISTGYNFFYWRYMRRYALRDVPVKILFLQMLPTHEMQAGARGPRRDNNQGGAQGGVQGSGQAGAQGGVNDFDSHVQAARVQRPSYGAGSGTERRQVGGQSRFLSASSTNDTNATATATATTAAAAPATAPAPAPATAPATTAPATTASKSHRAKADITVRTINRTRGKDLNSVLNETNTGTTTTRPNTPVPSECDSDHQINATIQEQPAAAAALHPPAPPISTSSDCGNIHRDPRQQSTTCAAASPATADDDIIHITVKL